MSAYSRFEDALIAKMRIHEWYQTQDGARYLAGFFADMNRHHDPDERVDIGGLGYLQKQMVEHSDPIYVSMDIVDIIDHARWSWNPEVLLPGDAFVPRGFAIFPKPVMIEDAPYTKERPHVYKEGVPVRAIAWYPMHSEDLSVGCYWIAFYIHVEDDERINDGRWTPADIQDMRSRTPLMLGHQWQWTWGKDPSDNAALTYLGETKEQGRLRSWQQAALIQTFWRLGSQFVPVKERVPRALWRDSRRKGIEHRDVNIMLLRRAKPSKEHDHDTGRTMKVRSITSGHWRNQHYSTMGPAHLDDGSRNPMSHRQIWIAPYMRGPDDAPLVLPARGIEFRR